MDNLISEVGTMLLRIGIFGESRVGKTSLIQYFITKQSKKTFSTESPEMHRLTLTIKPHEEELDIEATIFDTPGQERYYSMVKQYFEGLDGIILVYDVSNVESFKKVNNWIDKLKENLDDSKIVIFLVGNKIDIPERKVTQQEGENKAKEFNYIFQETSAKEGTNVEKMFESICTKAYLQVSKVSQSKSLKKCGKCCKCC